MNADQRSREDLLAEIDALRLRLEESAETLRAIRNDEVDAFVVDTAQGERIFTLQGAEHPYRVLVESMNEGAATLTIDGYVLYCNQRLAKMLAIPLEKLIGSPLGACVAPADALTFAILLEKSRQQSCQETLELITGDGVLLPVLFSCAQSNSGGNPHLNVVITDLSEQKRSARLMEAERLARSIIEQAGEAIVVCDIRGRITRINEQANRLLRKTSSAQTPFNDTLPLRIVAPASTVQRPANALFSIATPLSGSVCRNLEVVLERANQRVAHFLLNAAPLYNDQDRIFGCVVTLTDISERKQVEEALASSEKRLRLFFEYAPVALAMFDREMCYLYASQHWLNAYGLGKRDLQGLSHYDVFPEIGADWKDAHRRGLAGEVLRSEGDRFVRSDGSLQWVRWEIRPWYTGQESIGGIVIFSEDITASKVALSALQESEARIRARSEELDKLLDAVPAAVWIAHDTQSLQITGNALSYQWLRIPQGSNASKSAPENERPQTFRVFKDGAEVITEELPVQVAATGVEVRDYEHDIVYSDGGVRHLFGNATPLWDEQGKPRGCVSAFVDISARKNAEEALRKALIDVQRHDAQMVTLNNMNERLLACASAREAYDIIFDSAENLFTENAAGALAIHDENTAHLQVVAAWGKVDTLPMRFAPGDCWSLCNGEKLEILNPAQAIDCCHFSHLPDRSYLCIPLLVQSKILGLLAISTRRQLPEKDFQELRNLTNLFGESIKLSLSNLQLRAVLREQAIHDVMTGLFNRRYLDETLPRELRHCQRSGEPISVAMLDLDHFKNFNDSYGHEAGDLVLQMVGGLLHRSLRASDIACRYGGEEMTVVMTGSTLVDAHTRLDALRKAIMRLQLHYRGSQLPMVTVSIGVAQANAAETSSELLVRADAALYQAKTSGRNRVIAAATE